MPDPTAIVNDAANRKSVSFVTIAVFRTTASRSHRLGGHTYRPAWNLESRLDEIEKLSALNIHLHSGYEGLLANYTVANYHDNAAGAEQPAIGDSSDTHGLDSIELPLVRRELAFVDTQITGYELLVDDLLAKLEQQSRIVGWGLDQ